MTSKMVKGLRPGLMAVPLKGSISAGRRGMVFSSGLMGVTMKGSLRIIKLMGKAFISGAMEKPSKEPGETTNYTEKEFLLLKTAGYIKASIRTTRNMVLELLLGLMEDAIKVAGKTVNNMEKACIKATKIANPERESGRMERESSGWMGKHSTFNDPI